MRNLWTIGEIENEGSRLAGLPHYKRVWESVPTVDEIVAKMKEEILADIGAGRVPRDVVDFSSLHDHVDANCYGGAEQLLDIMNPDPKKSLELSCSVLNSAQAKIDWWIRSTDFTL